jgi:hypothetical protein
MRFVAENGPGSVWIEVDNEKVAEWQKGKNKAGNAVEKTCCESSLRGMYAL